MAMYHVASLDEGLLHQIFTVVLEEQKYPLGQTRSMATQSPWNLAMVCNGWRRVVFGAPSLWIRIELST